MNKQQAYELACKEYPEHSHAKEKRDRAMEIYAAAFAEWTQDNGYLLKNTPSNNIWFTVRHRSDTEYTTAELLIEFEKI